MSLHMLIWRSKKTVPEKSITQVHGSCYDFQSDEYMSCQTKKLNIRKWNPIRKWTEKSWLYKVQKSWYGKYWDVTLEHLVLRRFLVESKSCFECTVNDIKKILSLLILYVI